MSRLACTGWNNPGLMRISLLLLLFLPTALLAQEDFDSCLEGLGRKLALELTFMAKSKVAVSDLVTLHGDSNSLGMAASEELTVALVHHALDFEVMDRAHLKAIFAEHRLALGGLMNDESLIELGKLESVDVIVTGTLSRLSDRYKVTVKALDTETATLLAAERAYFPRTKELDAIFDGAPLTPTPSPPVTLPPPADCHATGTGTVVFVNHADQALTLFVDALACGTTQKHTLAPGESMTMKGVCGGMVQYEAVAAGMQQAGSVYVYACNAKTIELKR